MVTKAPLTVGSNYAFLSAAQARESQAELSQIASQERSICAHAIALNLARFVAPTRRSGTARADIRIAQRSRIVDGLDAGLVRSDGAVKPGQRPVERPSVQPVLPPIPASNTPACEQARVSE